MNKVTYDASKGVEITGMTLTLVPVDHPSSYVVNGLPAVTTAVQEYDPLLGIFRTKNTTYVPDKQGDLVVKGRFAVEPRLIFLTIQGPIE